MIEQPISKLEVARRQLDTAIKLFFDNEDSLSVHVLAYASFKILLDIYPFHNDDGVGVKIDEVIQGMGWRLFIETANFLKHADRDPKALLEHHDIESAQGMIGFAIAMYRRLAVGLTPLMQGFDTWTRAICSDEFSIAPVSDPQREALEKEACNALKTAPHTERLMMGRLLTAALTRLWEEEAVKHPTNSLTL